jgi:prevent-host-death family protein
MTAWGAAKAKAQFSTVLDKAVSEGPQLVTRRKEEFVLMTRQQMLERTQIAPVKKPFVSMWDALRPSSGELFDYEFPRMKSKARAAKF